MSKLQVSVHGPLLDYKKIKKIYFDYLELYRFFNHGSLNGAASFSDFYWMQVYKYPYSKVGQETKHSLY